MTHELKTWPVYFQQVRFRTKTFEVRRDDRTPPYAEGDALFLREWNPVTSRYTGDALLVGVTLVVRGDPMPAGYCAMQIVVLHEFCDPYPEDHGGSDD